MIPASPRKILLLDLDGVLLVSRGYHASLRETVRRIGAALGFRGIDLPQETIDVFEDAGVTAEWDSGAICSCLLHRQAWRQHPRLALPAAPPLPAPPVHSLPLPDFRTIADRLLETADADRRPIERAEVLLLADRSALSAGHIQTIRHILHSARRLESSLTHRLIQELNLGSQRFGQVYGLAPALDVESMLERLDRPALAPEAARRLLEWSVGPGQHVAVFTKRPSLAPDGSGGSPEAELGLAAAGVPGLPMVGMGGLTWLSAWRGVEPEAFLKPSPVHVLAALRCALGHALDESLLASARLAIEGKMDEMWLSLSAAEVVVFEDSAIGLTSTRAAAELLARFGVRIHLKLVGVAESQAKRGVLRRAGVPIVRSLGAGLPPHLGG